MIFLARKLLFCYQKMSYVANILVTQLIELSYELFQLEKKLPMPVKSSNDS